MAVTRSEGGGVKVDDGGVLRGRRGRGKQRRRDNDQERRMDGLMKRTTVVRFEAGVEAACSEARDEAAACSGAGIEDDMWCRWRNGF
jgi:hypothetical protein